MHRRKEAVTATQLTRKSAKGKGNRKLAKRRGSISVSKSNLVLSSSSPVSVSWFPSFFTPTFYQNLAESTAAEAET